MFVIQINGADRSSHSQRSDADLQKDRFIASGELAETIVIVEKETFEPAQ